MKSKKVLVILLLLIVGSIFIFNSGTNNKKYFTVNGVKLAVGVDGVNQSDFPPLGEYEVTVNCNNITGKWNYGSWELELSNMTNTNATCNINFKSVPNTHPKLNTKIINLEGNDGVVNEVMPIDNSTFTPGNKLSQNEYKSLSNDTTYPFNWNSTNSSWISSNHDDSTTSTITFKPSISGQYQFCYIQSSEINYDYAKVYLNNTEIINLKGVGNSLFECEYLGNVTTSDTIKVTYSKDSSGSQGSDIVEFYLQGGTYNENITSYSDYRYEGKNPNNYVLFNNELWRIIGVFTDNTHGVTGEKLTKIIRNESIGGYAWNKSNTNNWDKASLKTILNDFYYNKTDGTSDASCYFYSASVNGNCDFTKIGLDPNARNMIQTVTWKLGGHNTNSATAQTFYTAERGTTVYGSNAKTVNANIGLMYPSDYGYSVLASDCARTTNLNSYNNADCGGKAWLLKNGYEWTMTHSSSHSGLVFIVDNFAYLSIRNAFSGDAVRPTAYLKSNVYVVSGTGTILDPYILGI